MRSVTTLFLAVNYCCSIMSQHYCSDLTRELFTNSEMLTTLLDPSTAIASPHPHLSLNHEGRWGTTDRFHNQFLPFSPVPHCSLGLGEVQACPFPDVVFPLFFCLPCLLPPFTVPCTRCAMLLVLDLSWTTAYSVVIS